MTEIIFTFLTLTLLEIVLGIDNLIFIALATSKLPKNLQKTARYIGITLALFIRIAMLFALSWVIGLKKDIFSLFDIGFSISDIFLFFGGMFLIIQSLIEIKDSINPEKEAQDTPNKKIKTTLLGSITQIILIDFVFSFDSIITAIAITKNIFIIIAAVTISMFTMVLIFNYVDISGIIKKYPNIKFIAVLFILFIGVILLFESFHVDINFKQHLYFGLIFSLLVEILSIVSRNKK